MDVAAVAKRKEAAFVEFLPRLEPVECIMQVAASYRGKLPMAVASGGFRPVIEAQLAHLNCLEWFSAIVTAEDTQRHKPQPDVFLTAAERLGVSAEECLVYEDADLGLQAAAAANMDAIDVRAFHSPKPL
jgi:beta-phosphoglucomutase-like phosphatase (HAD superfamily)